MFLLSANSHASTLIYLTGDGTGEGAAPVAMQTLEFLPGTGSFHIWVQPDVLFTGISLDVDRIGSAIRFTGSTVHNPMVGSDTRWLPGLIRNGTVTDDQVSRIEGGHWRRSRARAQALVRPPAASIRSTKVVEDFVRNHRLRSHQSRVDGNRVAVNWS